MAAPITATNEAMLMIDPPGWPAATWRCMCGITYLQHRYTEVRFTSCTRRHASMPVVRMESSSGGEIPALCTAMCTPPLLSTVVWYRSRTASSLVTSTCTNWPPTSSAASLPASSSMSATTTVAPSAASRRAVASPMPLPAPVITATRPASRCGFVLTRAPRRRWR